MRRATIGATALVAGLLFAACGSDADESSDTTAAESSDTAAGESAGGDAAACAEGKTIEDATLTIATGEPAFPPYVIDDDPASGKGLEAAIAMAVAEQMGFAADAVTWVRTGFDEAITPGPKTFDFNLQQYTINAERAQAVSFSDPYYSAPEAILGYADSPAATLDGVEKFADVKLGAAIGTTGLDYITNVIKPTTAPLVFDDTAAAKQALDAKQIDAIVADLPTALYMANVELEGAKVFGQLPKVDGATTNDFGMLFSLDNPLVECVNTALANLTASGELDAIQTEWMTEYNDAPVIGFG